MQDVDSCYIFCPSPVVNDRIFESIALILPPNKIIKCESFQKLLATISKKGFSSGLVILEKSPMSEFTFDALRKELKNKNSDLLVYDPLTEQDIFTALLDIFYPQERNGGFICTLPELPISHIIHMLSLTGVESIFEIKDSHDKKIGHIRISKNRIRAVRTKDYHGIQALKAICKWKKGTVQLVEPDKMIVFSKEDSLKEYSTDYILLKIMHDIDAL